MSDIEKDFQTIASLISMQMIATFGNGNPNQFNTLSDLHGRVMSAWSTCKPPPAP